MELPCAIASAVTGPRPGSTWAIPVAAEIPGPKTRIGPPLREGYGRPAVSGLTTNFVRASLEMTGFDVSNPDDVQVVVTKEGVLFSIFSLQGFESL